MKKVAIILVLVLIIVSLFSFTLTASAETEINYDAYDTFATFSKEYRQRFAGSVGESNAAQYIANKLLSYGYVSLDGDNSNASNLLQTFNGEMVIQNSQTFEYETQKFTSANVVAYKRCGNEKSKLLVLGCSYGNNYGAGDIKNEGAYESSSAVATLLSIASKLKTTNLDFDLAFVFFGAEYANFSGSGSFLTTNKQPILGYIDIDAIGGGDDLYIFYDDVKTPHGQLIDGLISKFGYDIKGAPFNKGLYAPSTEVMDRPYFHKGLYSANYLFMEKGIPCVHLFGYNWAEFGGGESSVNPDIIGTENDNFEYMYARYGDEFIAKRLNLASEFVCTTVLKNTELATAFEKYDNSYTSLYSNGVYWGIHFALILLAVILFVVGFVFASKKTQKVGSPDFATNSTFLNGNGADTGVQKSDDVFDFGNEPIISDNKDIDTQENSSGNSDDDIFGEF